MQKSWFGSRRRTGVRQRAKTRLKNTHKNEIWEFYLENFYTKPLSLSFFDRKSWFLYYFIFVCFCSALNETVPLSFGHSLILPAAHKCAVYWHASHAIILNLFFYNTKVSFLMRSFSAEGGYDARGKIRKSKGHYYFGMYRELLRAPEIQKCNCGNKC